MSAKKESSSTKIPVVENTDSGFLSEEFISGQNLSSDDLDTSPDSYCAPQVSIESKQLEDQGVCLSSGPLEDCLVDLTPVALPETSNRAEDNIKQQFKPDADLDTPAHIAAVHGCERTVSVLIKICPNKELLNQQNEFGHTPLHLAVMCRHSVVARMLVVAGVSLAIRDYAGETALHKAVANADTECISALLNSGHKHRKMADILDQKNYDGQTCVHLAASAGREDILRNLVYYGADVNVREGHAGYTALHIAVERGDEKVTRYLLERCPGLARHERDYAGHRACRLARTPQVVAMFQHLGDNDSDSDSDFDDYDSDNEQMYELSNSFRGGLVMA